MARNQSTVLNILARIGALAEDTLLVAFLLVLIGLSGLQIFLRNVMGTGFFWSDELLRILVLWLGILGAVAASRDDKHISIDVLTRFLPTHAVNYIRVAVDAFTCAVCGLIAWNASGFIQMEKEFGATVLGDLPAWLFEIILPVGFGLISYRYAVFAVVHLKKALAGGGVE